MNGGLLLKAYFFLFTIILLANVVRSVIYLTEGKLIYNEQKLQ